MLGNLDVSEGIDVVRDVTNTELVLTETSVSVLMPQEACTFLYIYIYMYVCM